MNKNIIILFSLFVVFTEIELLGQYHIEAFTHPLSNTKQKVSIYRAPDVYYKELKSDVEAGWIVDVKEKSGNYFQIDISDLKLRNIWIHIGDIGTVVQNYDSIAIPIYVEPDTTSFIFRYIYESCIGLIYDISDNMILLQICKDSECFFGWIERKYLCGSPYTTCN
jgi:hypothetical protein